MHTFQHIQPRVLSNTEIPLFTKGSMTKRELLRFIVGQTPNEREVNAGIIRALGFRIKKRGSRRSKSATCLLAGLNGQPHKRPYLDPHLSHVRIRRASFDIIYLPELFAAR